MRQLNTIFIVDDDPIYQFTICHKLKLLSLGEKVKTFSDGEEVLIFIIENLSHLDKLPDLIFLDINMPVMSGFDFLDEFAKIKSKINKDITIHMVSSSVDDVDIAQAINTGQITSYIIKPFQMEHLKVIISNYQNGIQ